MAIVGLGGEKLWLCPSLNDNPHDISGNGNNGTYNGGMGTVADVSKGGKRAYSFDGSNGYIRIGNRTNFNFLVQTNYWSMSAWVYHSDLSGQRTVIGGDADNSQHGVNLIESSYNGLGYRGFRAYGSLSAYSPDTRSNTTYTTGVWKHICWVVSGSSSKIYVDGVEEASESASFPTTSNSLTDDVIIGAYSSGTNLYSFMSGKQDDIRIFNRALTTAEIKHLAKARGITGTPLKKGLGDEKLWLCPSIDDSAEDLSGNGNNGTYNGGMGTVADTSNGGTRAYLLDGVDDYIGGSSSGVVGLSAYSVALWYNTANTSVKVAFNAGDGTYRRTCNVDNPRTNTTFNIGHQTTASNFFRPSSSSISANTWQHLVYTFDGSTFRLYIDGSLDSLHTSITASNVAEDRYRVGSFIGGGYYYSGYLDDIRTFDRALSTSEITHLASARGVAGSPYGFKGLGGEKLWLCPTLDDSAEDISGNRNHGTYYNGLTTVADVSNGGTRAYLLDGINKRIECPASAIGSEPIISVSCWGYVNVHDSSYGEGLVSQFGAGTNSSTCKFTVNASNGGSSSIFPAVGIRPSTTNVLAVSTSAISAQSWHHFCLVADGSKIYNYVDGVLQASTAYTGSVRSVTNPFVIGTYNQLINSNHYLNGRIDDVRAFDRALTQEEVTHLAKSRGVLGSPHNLNGIVHLLSSFIHPFT
jgi:hypothetical protein